MAAEYAIPPRDFIPLSTDPPTLSAACPKSACETPNVPEDGRERTRGCTADGGPADASGRGGGEAKARRRCERAKTGRAAGAEDRDGPPGRSRRGESDTDTDTSLWVLYVLLFGLGSGYANGVNESEDNICSVVKDADDRICSDEGLVVHCERESEVSQVRVGWIGRQGHLR